MTSLCGFCIYESDLTDYSKLVPHEMRYHKQYKVKYYKLGKPTILDIQGIEYKGDILFDEFWENHLTLKGHIFVRSYNFKIFWHDPYEKKIWNYF